MNGYEIFDALGDLEPSLIERAENHVFRRKSYLKPILATAAGLVLVTGIALNPFTRFIFNGAGSAMDTSNESSSAPSHAETVADTVEGDLTGSSMEKLQLISGENIEIIRLESGEYTLTNHSDRAQTVELAYYSDTEPSVYADVELTERYADSRYVFTLKLEGGETVRLEIGE